MKEKFFYKKYRDTATDYMSDSIRSIFQAIIPRLCIGLVMTWLVWITPSFKQVSRYSSVVQANRRVRLEGK